MLSSTPPITIAFPVHPRLNADGQFNKLQRSGFDYFLLNTTTNQTKRLEDEDLIVALKAVVEPLMS